VGVSRIEAWGPWSLGLRDQPNWSYGQLQPSWGKPTSLSPSLFVGDLFEDLVPDMCSVLGRRVPRLGNLHARLRNFDVMSMRSAPRMSASDASRS
jgi:hypothetical protein